MLEQDITIVGLSLALQRTLEFDVVRPGEVNRARRATQTASGKGANVARVLTALGARPTLIGFNGGDTGKAVEQDLARTGIRCELIPTAAPTRICQTLLDDSSGQATELVEEASPPTPDEWRAFHERFKRILPDTRLLVITGTLIPGAPQDLYAGLAQAATTRNIPWIIDSQQAPLKLSLAHEPVVAKLNEQELAVTCGITLHSDDDLIAAAASLLEAGAQNVLVTCGARGAWLITPGNAKLFEPPTVQAINPIGSGDAVTAGMAHALFRGRTMEEAARLGMACGAANAATRLPGFVDRSILPNPL